MLCDLLNRELRFACRGFLRFLEHSLSSAMGCFFVCLRVKDDDHHPNGRSHAPAPDKKSDVAASRNQLSSLFAAEENEDSFAENKGSLVSGSPHIGKEIKDEARFLKACGTIPETPFEIRKAGEKLRRSPRNVTQSDTPEFHSWMPNTSVRKLQTDKQQTNLSGSEIASESPGRTPISNNCDINRSASINITDGVASGGLGSEVIDDETSSTRTPFTPWPTGRSTQGANKSVRFDHSLGACPHDKSLTGDALKEVTSKDSTMTILPPPTPLKLSDGMQTPGTVFPANMENLQKGKASIRSQYVYSVPNPVTDSSQGNDMEEKAQHNQLSDEETKFEPSVSAWLKPPTDSGRNFQQAFRRTYGDRPILGLVATHWNEEELTQTHITPKWWDGNGIPNSTSKYNEDQKVNWHATPFEERLEKALSEESSLGNRSHVGGSTTPEEDGDSAISRLRTTPQKKTLVSC
ncbi:hypothetical protein MLD38_020065 [Melastoma candidum]|uniref:Uncharacterized protein n=1 Tax=Melastoma candidum TaxID=119954 RepID=A0ACB9QBA9_9MYRT|nr:hypothetical protein MLD38_020065 [Melastoma candidum]